MSSGSSLARQEHQKHPGGTPSPSRRALPRAPHHPSAQVPCTSSHWPVLLLDTSGLDKRLCEHSPSYGNTHTGTRTLQGTTRTSRTATCPERVRTWLAGVPGHLLALQQGPHPCRALHLVPGADRERSIQATPLLPGYGQPFQEML